jgi:hypothetical protein
VIETIFIKTKASDATEAALKDFIEPQNVKLVFGGSSVEYNGPYCQTGSVTPTLGAISTGTFAAFESDGITPAGSKVAINTTSGEINLANSTPGSYVIKFSFSSLGCNKTVQDVIEIKAPPTIALGTITPYCRVTETGDRNLALSYTATTNSPTQYKITFDDVSLTGKDVDWTNLPNPTSGTINIPVPKNLAAGNYSFKLRVKTASPSGTLAGCESGEYTVNFAIKAATVFSINESGGNCPGASKTFTYNYTSGSSASSYAWYIVGNTTSIGSSSSVNYSNPSTCGSYTVKLDVTNADGCTSTQEKLVNVVDAIAPEFSSFAWESSISCGTAIPDPTTNKPGATDNCGTPSVTLLSTTTIDVGACGNKVVKRVWKALDACDNYVTREQIIFVTDETAPVLTCPVDVSVDNLSQATAVATAVDGCSSGTDVKVFSIDIPNGANSVRRRWWAIDASGNKSAYCDQIITINPPPQTQISSQRTVAAEMKAPAPAIKKQLQIKAFPNPYNNKVNFSFTPNKSGYAVLDLVDLNGRKVATVFKGNVLEGQSKTVSYENNTGTKVPLIYRLTIGNEIKSGKILPTNN